MFGGLKISYPLTYSKRQFSWDDNLLSSCKDLIIWIKIKYIFHRKFLEIENSKLFEESYKNRAKVTCVLHIFTINKYNLSVTSQTINFHNTNHLSWQ